MQTPRAAPEDGSEQTRRLSVGDDEAQIVVLNLYYDMVAGVGGPSEYELRHRTLDEALDRPAVREHVYLPHDD